MHTAGVTVHQLLKYFAMGCIGLAIYGFVHAWRILDMESFEQILSLGHKSFTNHISIQPLYLSVYFLLILFFFLEMLRTKGSNLSVQWRVMIVCLIGVAIVMIFFLRSKTALLLLPTLLIIYVVIVLKKRGWWVAFVLLLVTLLTFLLDKNGPPDIIDSYGRTVSKAFDQRLLIWQGAWEGIKQSPVLGAGTGDAQELLNEGYAKIGYEEGVLNEFNAHNQYLQFMARNGLLELIVFLAILGYCFWHSAKESNYTFLMFNILVAFVMITESFLSVQKGIVFFYFFSLAFTYLGSSKSAEAKML
jgi:O-antigen ligase